MIKNIEYPQTIVKTFWRSQLYKTFCQLKVLRKIICGNTLSLVSENWDDYWKDIPPKYKNSMLVLKKTWEEYLVNNLNYTFALSYNEAYFNVLFSIVNNNSSVDETEKTFLTRLLSFENVLLYSSESSCPFAALTINKRNPNFLSFQSIKIRLDERNDPSLLPLIIGIDNSQPYLFYHYRKQRLIKNTDENLLFFLSVEKQNRQLSFCGLDSLTDTLADTWDSRIDQRSRMIVDKILTHLIRNNFKTDIKSLKILDIGSGDGEFTSSIICRLLKSGVLKKRKLELSLLDIMDTDKTKVFSNKKYINELSKAEYISHDYREWISKNEIAQQYDIVFLFRILHNMSSFKILSESLKGNKFIINKGRYRIFPHLSNYYKGISLIFNQQNAITKYETDKSYIYYPARIFNECCLNIQEDTSLIEKLVFISRFIIIEDGDLTREILIDHISQYLSKPIFIYDLSKYLRLKTNHIFLISSQEQEGNLIGEKIWPPSKS
jgi:hypothetical protein